MKKSILCFSIILLLLLTSCSPHRSDTMNQQNQSAEKQPNIVSTAASPNNLQDKSTWRAVSSIDTGYVKLDDINPGSISEIKIRPSVVLPGTFITTETTDGFLYGYSNLLDAVFSALKIEKYDKLGKRIWSERYEYNGNSSRITNLLVYPDNSFVYTVQTSPDQGKSFISRCDSSGKELWRKDFADHTGQLLQNLHLLQNGDIVAVGSWGGKDGNQNQSDIVITKFDANGNVIIQKSYGGSNFESISISKYNNDLGIIVAGWTQSNDGNFPFSSNGHGVDFIACFDQSLNLKWASKAGDNENLICDSLALANDSIYIIGGYKKGEDFTAKFDTSGKRIWTKTGLYDGLRGRTIAILKSGDIAVSSGGRNLGKIVVLCPDGTIKKTIDDLKLSADVLSPTDDGGFIATANREIKVVPQPLYISSIWYDTELVAVKYSSSFEIEWRKTYDHIKDELGSDYAFPLKNGSIVIDSTDN